MNEENEAEGAFQARSPKGMQVASYGRMDIREKNRLANLYRREAREKWALVSPLRQSLYIKARIAGRSPEESIARSRGNLRSQTRERA